MATKSASHVTGNKAIDIVLVIKSCSSPVTVRSRTAIAVSRDRNLFGDDGTCRRAVALSGVTAVSGSTADRSIVHGR